MKTARFIHTVVNGKEELFSTANFDEILNDKNLLPLLSSSMSGEQTYYDDKAISYTSVTPNSEPGGRSFTTTEAVICKFSDEELIGYLKPEEILMLLRRINNRLDLSSRMRQALHDGGSLCNPLPEMKI